MAAIDHSTNNIIRSILIRAGMPEMLARHCEIERDKEANLAVTFKLVFPDSRVCFLKFHEKEGARGGPFIKHLLPIQDLSMREHAAKRRCFIRKVLESVVIHYRPHLVPRPLYFNLEEASIALEKAKAKEEGILAEYRVEEPMALLNGRVGTLWEGLEIDHLPLLDENQISVWDPICYSPQMIFRCTAAIGELQRECEKALEEVIQKKKGTREEVLLRLEEKLKHEQRALIGYDTLLKDFLSVVGDASVLPITGKRLIDKIEKECTREFGDSSIERLQQEFLKTVTIPPEDKVNAFHKQIFIAEREGWWSVELMYQGKRLAQLGEAFKIAQAFQTRPEEMGACVAFIKSFKETYAKIESLKKSIVPQDGHPFNFFIHRTDHKTSMLDLEDMSMGVRFADLSTVYLYKILRAYIGKKISKETAQSLIEATLEGYNSEVSERLSHEEISLMADYTLAAFLNHLSQFGVILRMQPEELNTYNLAMNLEEFLTLFNQLRKSSEAWNKLVAQDESEVKALVGAS